MGHEILLSTPKTSQMGHEILFLTPKVTWPLHKWATKSYFRRPKLHNGPRNLIFDAQSHLATSQMGHKIVFSTPKIRCRRSNWATKTKIVAQISVWAAQIVVALDPNGPRKKKTWPKLRYGRGNIRGPSLLFGRPNADIERRFFFFAAQTLGFDPRTSKTFSPPHV